MSLLSVVQIQGNFFHWQLILEFWLYVSQRLEATALIFFFFQIEFSG